MKIIKLFLLLCLGVWADFKLNVLNDVNISGDKKTLFIKEIRKSFDHTQYKFDTNITKINDIQNVHKKEKLLEVLETLFPIYLEDKNPLSMLDYSMYSNKRYPMIEVAKFLQLATLYINEFNTGDVSNRLLKKTLVSISQVRKEMESVSSYMRVLLLEQSFLENIECKASNVENILINYTRINIDLGEILKNEKKKFMQSLIGKIRTWAINNNKEIESEAYMTKMKTILSREIDEYNLNILLVLKKNSNHMDEDIERFIEKKETEVDKLALSIKTRVNSDMTMYDFIKVPQNLNDWMELKGQQIALAYMYVIGPVGRYSMREVNMRKLYTKLLDSCTN